jgi:hypothetical protein
VPEDPLTSPRNSVRVDVFELLVVTLVECTETLSLFLIQLLGLVVLHVLGEDGISFGDFFAKNWIYRCFLAHCSILHIGLVQTCSSLQAEKRKLTDLLPIAQPGADGAPLLAG